MLFVPSFWPKRLRGVDCAADVDDVLPKPNCDQRITARPNAMRVRLRMAWTATCGSFAQAWMAMSPPEVCSSMKSLIIGGRSVNSLGNASERPKRSVPSSFWKSDRPNPKVIVKPYAPRSAASPVSSGGISGLPSNAPLALTCSPIIIRFEA